LLKILDDNKDTEFGKAHGLSEIKSIAEYRERVPVSSYADYRDFIMRMSEQGERNVITSAPIHHYSKSSGTSGEPKRIPTSDEALQLYAYYNGGLSTFLATEALGGEWAGKRGFSVIEGVDTLPVLPDGSTFGALSAKSGLRAKDYIELLRTSPKEAAYPLPGTDTRYLHARFGLMERNVGVASASFFSMRLRNSAISKKTGVC